MKFVRVAVIQGVVDNINAVQFHLTDKGSEYIKYGGYVKNSREMANPTSIKEFPNEKKYPLVDYTFFISDISCREPGRLSYPA